MIDYVPHLYPKLFNKRRSQMSVTAIIWVFANQRPTFVMAHVHCYLTSL